MLLKNRNTFYLLCGIACPCCPLEIIVRRPDSPFYFI